MTKTNLLSAAALAVGLLLSPDAAMAIAMGSQTAVDHHAEMSRNEGRISNRVDHGISVTGRTTNQGTVRGGIREGGGSGSGGSAVGSNINTGAGFTNDRGRCCGPL